jgi:hypothetical protein
LLCDSRVQRFKRFKSLRVQKHLEIKKEIRPLL